MKILEFKTITKPYGPVNYKDKGSKFISYIFPINNLDEINNKLNHIRKEYFDSTHVCYAYRIIQNDGKVLFRYNDDGEPSHTAGLPIFNEIKGYQYFNVLLLVIRYYGGTNLGCGGLTRAYKESSRMILNQTSAKVIHKESPFLITVPFTQTGEVMNILNKYQIKIASRNFNKNGLEINIFIKNKELSKIKDIFKKNNIKLR